MSALVFVHSMLLCLINNKIQISMSKECLYKKNICAIDTGLNQANQIYSSSPLFPKFVTKMSLVNFVTWPHSRIVLPLRSTSIEVFLHWGCLLFRSSSIEVVFHCGRFHQNVQHLFVLYWTIHTNCFVCHSFMEVIFHFSKKSKTFFSPSNEDLHMLQSKFGCFHLFDYFSGTAGWVGGCVKNDS